jgi:hypothetical protein
MSERKPRPLFGGSCLGLILLAGMLLYGYWIIFGTSPLPKRAADLITAYTWKTYPISFYDLTVSLPQSWTLDEFDRWLEVDAAGNETDQGCVNYILQNPEKTVVIYIQSPCGFLGDVQIRSCIPGMQTVDEKIGRYLDMLRDRYVYTRTGFCTQNSRDFEGQRSIDICCQDIFFMGHTTVMIEAQYTGSETDRDRLMATVDRIVLSIK